VENALITWMSEKKKGEKKKEGRLVGLFCGSLVVVGGGGDTM